MARTLTSDGSLSTPPRVQVAQCLACSAALEFSTGRFGQTLERCTQAGCVNARRAHRVQVMDRKPREPREPRALGPAPKKQKRRGPTPTKRGPSA